MQAGVRIETKIASAGGWGWYGKLGDGWCRDGDGVLRVKIASSSSLCCEKGPSTLGGVSVTE